MGLPWSPTAVRVRQWRGEPCRASIVSRGPPIDSARRRWAPVMGSESGEQFATFAPTIRDAALPRVHSSESWVLGSAGVGTKTKTFPPELVEGARPRRRCDDQAARPGVGRTWTC